MIIAAVSGGSQTRNSPQNLAQGTENLHPKRPVGLIVFYDSGEAAGLAHLVYFSHLIPTDEWITVIVVAPVADDPCCLTIRKSVAAGRDGNEVQPVSK